MQKLVVLENFHVFAPRKVEYRKGMVLDLSEVPEDQSVDDWVDKGLAKLATPST